MKTIDSKTLKKGFLISAAREYKNNKSLVEIAERLFSVIEHELGVTKKEIQDNGSSYRIRTAKTHYAHLATEAGLEENALAYFMHKMVTNVRILLENHKERMQAYRDPYKKDHEEITAFLNGSGKGLSRGVENQIIFSENEFLEIFNRIQTHKDLLDSIISMLRKLSKEKKGKNIVLSISQRKLEDFIYDSGICRRNVVEIVEHLMMFAQ